MSSVVCFSTDSKDVYFNLACEEYLLSQVCDRDRYLFVWVSSPSVVIGKNQNPWREVDLDYIQQNGIELARRLSGGGAVYHDPGNLNCSFITSRRNYHPEENWEILDHVLADYNLKTERSSQHSLTVDGLKISGNAFCLQRNYAMHHFTLLVDADRNAMKESLCGSIQDIETHAVASVPARVTNLKKLNSNVNLLDLKTKLYQSYLQKWGGDEIRHLSVKENKSQISSLMDKYRSDAWIWGRTPAFQVKWMLGSGLISFRIVEGLVDECHWRSDESGHDNNLEELKGCPFHSKDLYERLSIGQAHHARQLQERLRKERW